MVSFFEWIRPFALNAKLCIECRSIVQRVLDQHFDGDATWAGDRSVGSWDLFTQPSLSFELMDTSDWLRFDVQQ